MGPQALLSGLTAFSLGSMLATKQIGVTLCRPAAKCGQDLLAIDPQERPVIQYKSNTRRRFLASIMANPSKGGDAKPWL